LFVNFRVRNGYGREQCLAVRVQRISVEFSIGCQLDDAAQVHDGDPIADVFHHAQIVGNEKIGQVHLLLKLGQKIDHLRLNGDIQGRYWFIAYDDQRI